VTVYILANIKLLSLSFHQIQLYLQSKDVRNEFDKLATQIKTNTNIHYYLIRVLLAGGRLIIHRIRFYLCQLPHVSKHV